MANTVSDELSAAVRRLREAGIESPQLDAQLMMAYALGCSRLDVISHPERVLTTTEEMTFHCALDRRAARCPLAYIVGCKEFFGLEIDVSPAVLIPRPETEILVEECLKRVGEEPLIADVGTGSGAIAVALAVSIPRARLWATDTSEEALKVARANSEKHGVATRVSIVRGDLLEPLMAPGVGPGHHVPAQLWGVFDAIVSNPPYILSGDIESLQPEVRCEPREALDGGPDGLDAYRRLFVQAVGLAKRSSVQESFLEGFVAVEIGIEQADPVAQIAREAGWADVEIVRDLAGIERVVIVRQ